jgi:hypothetical protein
MRRAAVFYSVLGVGVFVLSFAVRVASVSQQTVDVNGVLGKWNSTERFEDEPRISVAFRRNGTSIEGWALLLGQHRNKDDRATLGLSFTNATWNGQAVRFSTVLPEDEGTIGWELHPTTPTTAVLTTLTENGQPIQDQLKWDMTR